MTDRPTRDTARLLDLRTLGAARAQAHVFATFALLPPAAAMEMILDQDPAALHARFDAWYPGEHAWRLLEDGPGDWRVRVERLAARAWDVETGLAAAGVVAGG